MMKKMLMLALAAVSVLTAQAATVSYSLTATSLLDGRTNTAVIGSAALTKLTWANGGTAGAITLIDSGDTNQTISIGNYTNFTSYATNYSAVTTNAQGVLQTNSYTGTYTLTTIKTNSATTPLPRLLLLTAAANETVVFEPTSPIFFTRGILVTNSQSCSITLDYMTVR